MEGLAAVQSRIAQIQSNFTFAPPVAVASGSNPGFAQVLASAEAAQTTAAPGVSVDGTVDTAAERTQFAHDVLAQLGLPATAENVRAMVAWQQAEGTKAQFNPFATTQGWNGASNFNSVGVKNYESYADGIAATVKTMKNGFYDGVLDALRTGNSAEAVGRAVAASPWGTGEGVLAVLAKG